METTVGQLLINESLPESMRDHNRVLDKKGIEKLLAEVAEKHPDQYRTIVKQLSDVGRDAAFTTGGYSFGLKSLRQSVAAKQMRVSLQKELRDIYASPEHTPATRQEAILTATRRHAMTLSGAVLKEAESENNPLAGQVRSGSRGNASNLNSLIGADLLYTDHRGVPIPIPVMNNYGHGLTPAEYMAGAYGTRKGIIDLKSATQDAGFFAKQLVQAAHRLLVSQNDDENVYDPSNPRGLPVPTNDMDNEGALLAHPVGGYDRNAELTPRILKDLHARGFENILVRSPMVGGPADGGVYGRDVGRREKGMIAPVGDYVGISAAQALAEPVTQAQISSKHSGGVAGAGAGAIGGFKFINQLVQVPKKFRGGTTHAQVDGRVSEIEPLEWGGYNVTIAGQTHYVPHKPTVKTGDEIEAGDMLSDGVANPAEVVMHKGHGEGRRYLTEALRTAFADSGIFGHRRNIELLARGLVNHVRLTDEVGDWAPDDVIPYQSLERSWQPRPGHTVVPPQHALGQYLERPVLHYTVGTKVRPSVLKQLQAYNVPSVYTHKDPPPFKPEMVRGMANVAQDPDWMTRFLGSYQKDSLLEGARRGAVSDDTGTSYVAPLARGIDFGRTGATKGWKVPEPPKPPSSGQL